jgi:hypothetical protein
MALKFKQSSNPCWICICSPSICRETWRRIPGTQVFCTLEAYKTLWLCGIQIPDWRCLSATSSSLVGLKSISSCAPYVILESKIGWREVKMCQFGSRKWFYLSIIVEFCSGWYKPQQHCAPAEKSAINMIWLLLSVSDWSRWFAIVVPHLFDVPVSVLWVGLKKK